MTSTRLLMGGALLVWLASGTATVALTPQAPAAAQVPAAADSAKVLQRYCISCHNDRLRTAGLTLDGLDVAHPEAKPEVWEKVIRRLRSRTMPPVKLPRPDDATYDGLATFLETSLDRVAAAHPNPARPLLHRMNRTEYKNAVRDLLALDVDVSALPADDATYGFDNIADALGTSPLLLESYVTVARKIARLALGNPTIPAVTTTYTTPEDLTQDYHLRDLPLGTRGGIRVEEHLPVDAEYELRVRLRRTAGGTIRGIGEEHQLELTLDGQRVGLFAVGGKDAYKPVVVNEQNPGQTVSKAFTADEHMFVRTTIPAGTHTITAAFVGKPPVLSEQPNKPFLRSYVAANPLNGLPDVDRLMVTGPFKAERPKDTPSRAQIFSCRPAAPADERACARTILSRLGRLAYRRAMTPAELDVLLGFYDQERRASDFEGGIELAIRYILTSPQFIFRLETEPADLAPGGVYALNDLDLASRLSFFLWSSIPDDTLLMAAERGQLKDPAELERQVRRMLADSRAEAMVENFAGQWLYLRNLTGTRPDPPTFPDFDDNLRTSLRRETELFFTSVMQENRSVIDLLTADYTFLNERLARHYGVPSIYGDRFRRVQVTDPQRRGLLGHGSLLTVTSYATRTSPVLRGKWILENLLGAPPPPPPPNVPDLENTAAGEALSVRERLTRHRANPACAVCHSRMDPYGFGLENFDAVGRWRDSEGDGKPIDSSDTLPDGTRFKGPAELRAAIVHRPEEFVKTFTRKLLTYAVGRGLEFSDEPIVRQIVRQAAPDQYRFSSIIAGIVTSEPFRLKMKRAVEDSQSKTVAGH
jgi:mono/diheme cytochrome c family protein